MFKFLNAEKEIDTLANYADTHDVSLEEMWALTKPILIKAVIKGVLCGVVIGSAVLIAKNELSKI